MTTLLDQADVRPQTTPAQRLRITTAASRVSFTWLGVRKSLTADQKNLAAMSFGAEGDVLSAGKKLLDVRHPAFRSVTTVKGRIVAYWKGSTLPYPDPGIRLIRQERIEEFDSRMNEFREELAEVVAQLDEHYGEFKAAAARRLGTLYDESDYPESLRNWFSVDWSYPAVEPPDYLMELHPRLYEEERSRVASRFDEAVQLAEEAFTSEFAKLVAHLSERIGGADGQPKIFRDSVVNNLSEFFERFRTLSVRSNSELDDLIGQVQQIVQGIGPQDLRKNGELRQQVSQQLNQVQTALDDLLVDRPRRRILRNTPARENH